MSGQPQSLAFRLLFTAVLWSAVTLVLAGLFITTLYQRSVERAFDERLGVYLKVLIGELTFDADTSAELPDPGNLGEPRFALPLSGWYWLISRADTAAIVLTSESLAGDTLALPAPSEAAATGSRPWKGYGIGPGGTELRILSRRITFPDNTAYLVTVAGNADDIRNEISGFRYSVAGALALLGIGLVIGIILQVRIGLRPLGRMREALAAIRTGSKDRLDGEYPRDIAPLANELNALIESNRQVVERARTHVGNLAHALKTPLSVILNESRAQSGPLANKVVEQSEQMQDQIAHHLERARMAAQRRIIGAVTSVGPVATRLVRAMQRIYETRGLDIRMIGDESLRFAGEQQDLEEMLGNLLDNACKWAKGEVVVSLRGVTERIGGDRAMLRIEVADDGAGLTPEQRREALKRGKRLDETVPGSGLGLSIVAELAGLYGGRLSLEQSELGGLGAVLELPSV
ncbi:MAG: histidine kinase [Hyphomicrobiales bacterium]|nr:MAG: histidine kinase [Hyphomicrobiales bacterium]